MPLTTLLARVTVLPPPRLGERPRMQRALPHLQLDQLPRSEATEELIERSLEIPNVRSRESRMAGPMSHALYLADEFALGPSEAFIDDHEFCHLHPSPEGSIHLTLPKLLREEVVRLAWGERHPIAESGILTTLVTVYAPREREELDAVLGLIVQSCHFAQGKLQVLHDDERGVREVR
jgi:phospholipase/carboxylesterase